MEATGGLAEIAIASRERLGSIHGVPDPPIVSPTRDVTPVSGSGSMVPGRVTERDRVHSTRPDSAHNISGAEKDRMRYSTGILS